MTTRVVNVRDLPRDPADWPASHEYIGRAAPSRRLAGSPWRNPYRIGVDGDREQVLARFEAYLQGRPDLLMMIPVLRGRTLVCWCKPDACHGDVLVRLADALR